MFLWEDYQYFFYSNLYIKWINQFYPRLLPNNKNKNVNFIACFFRGTMTSLKNKRRYAYLVKLNILE